MQISRHHERAINRLIQEIGEKVQLLMPIALENVDDRQRPLSWEIDSEDVQSLVKEKYSPHLIVHQ